MILEGIGAFQHRIELAPAVERKNPWSVVAPTNEFLTNPNGWDRRTANYITELCTDGSAIAVLVQLYDCVFGSFCVKNVLGL